MQEELEASLSTLEQDEQNAAAIELARTYARQIDNEGPVDVLGPKLLSVLESLGLTPRSRNEKGSRDDSTTGSPLDELRNRRARRHGAANMDSTAAGANA